MASSLSVIFNAVDNISSRLSAIASAGRESTSCFSEIENQANNAFESIQSGADEAGDALQQAASSTDYWTDAIGNYDRGAMQAIYSTQELVDMGYMTEDALEAEARAAEEASRQIDEYGDAAEEAGDESEDMGDKSKKAVSDLDKLIAGAGIIAGLKAIAGAFSDCTAQAEIYETSIAKLATIAGQSNVGTLSAEIKELSNETGIASDQLADVAYNAISAGTAIEDSVNMAGTASKLATAGFTDTASALSVLTTTINAYGDAAGTAEEISDSLIMVQNLGVTTVAELSANMGKAIASASAYNVSLGNLEAAYISTTKAGINTAESTTYISGMLKELGDSGSAVAKIIQEQTGESFGQLMADGYSLGDVLGMLYESVNRDGEALMNLWGSAEAGKAANAIISQGLEEFNENLQAVENSAGATASAYSIMADTTAYAHERMNNSAENFKQTVGSQLNPALEKLYNVGATVLEGLTGFIDKYPIVTKLVVALTAGLTAAIVVIGTYTAAQKLMALAQEIAAAATATETAALAAQVAIVGGVVVALGVLIGLLLSTADAEEELTASSQAQKEELQDLQAEYDNACNAYGENSEEALALKYQVDDLTASYEASKMTLEQFYTKLDEVCSKHDDIVNTYNDTNTAIAEQDAATNDLITRLNDLKESSDGSVASQKQMESIVAKLSQMYPNLGISIEDVNTNLDGLIDRINTLSGANNKQIEYENATKTYADLVAEQSELEAIRDEAWENYLRAGEKYADAGVVKGTWDELWGTGVASAYDDASDAYDRASEALEENLALQEECIAIMEEYGEVVTGTSEEMVSAEDAVAIAINQTSEEITALVEAYQEAYDSALTSIEGQYALWESVGEIATTSVSDIMSAMESQTAYWETYSANLENLANRNIEGLDALVASMDDGSEDSAAALAAMASASDEELQSMVTSFNSLQEAQTKTADDMADLETNFSESLSQIQQDMNTAVDNMNMEDDAAAAAKATMQAYIDEINAMKSSAVSAANQVAIATANALANTQATPTVPGHADGTLDSEKVYIAGEEGPELIISGGGDKVFPTSETDKILSAVTSERADNPIITEAPAVAEAVTLKSSDDSASKEEKTITLKLEGSGSLSVDKDTSADSVWDSIKDNLKSTFIALLKEEVFEEGAGVYEF